MVFKFVILSDEVDDFLREILIESDATFEDLGLDSLDIAELVMEIEDKLGVTIELSAELNNIDKLVDYIEEQV